VSEEKRPLPNAEALRRMKDEKPHRALTLIALALAGALALFLFLLIRPQAAPESTEPEGTSYQLIERDRTLLRSIAVAMAGSDPYTLINQNDYDLSDKNDVLGEEYALEGQPDFAVSTAQVLPMESYASDLSVQDLAARSPDDLEQYGLKAPSMTVTIGYRDNVREKLIFGGPVPTGGYYYLQHVGDPAVYVAAESIYEAFHRPLDELKQTAEEKANLDAARALEATAQPDGADTTANSSDAEATTDPDALDATASPTAPDAIAQPGSATVTTQP
jgi:hypothetical protein